MMIGLTLLVAILVIGFGYVYYHQQRNPQQEMEDALVGEDHYYGTDNLVDLADEMDEVEEVRR